jgi:hypothetical protein
MVAGTICACGSAKGAPLTEVPIGGEYLDVEYIVGTTGSNLSLVIIDFQVTGGESYAFGYRWSDDTALNLDNMLKSIADNGELNAIFKTDPGFGEFLSDLEYAGNSGNADEWRLDVGTYSGSTISWEIAETGLSSLTSLHFTEPSTFDSGTFLGTAGIIGFYNSFAGFPFGGNPDTTVKPRIPTAVPEPAAWILALSGVVAVSLRLRRCLTL